MNAQSQQSGWPSISGLLTSNGPADVALIGVPLDAGSVTPGRCDLAPGVIRASLRRFSTYDVDTGRTLTLSIRDLGDVPVQGIMPVDAFDPVRRAVAAATAGHRLAIVLGGNNAVTRPAAHALGVPIERVGLITLDAHFDMRDTSGGLLNGNPVRALLEDGLPGRNICQIGLAPYANTAAMHQDAAQAGIGVYTIAACKQRGIETVLKEALDRIAHVEAVMVDFDIDVIDRSQCPGAPGARPGGMPVDMFFAAARYLAARREVRLVDLTEFDPPLDVGAITTLAAGRWLCEILAGFSERPDQAS